MVLDTNNPLQRKPQPRNALPAVGGAPMVPGGQMITSQATSVAPGGAGGAPRPAPVSAPSRPMQPGPQTPQAPAPIKPAPQGSMVTTTAQPQPPMGPPPPLPSVGGASVAPINPSADLRSTQITPSATPRLETAQGRTDSAAGNVAGFDTGSTIGGFQSQFAGPDTRSQIAKDRLAAFDLENMQGVKDLQRASIQNAARGGRIGMGDEGVNALRPFTDFMTSREALKHRLAADTAEGEIGDRMGVLDRAIGATGMDRAGDLSTFGALSNFERGVGDFEGEGRDELRGERDYQTMLSRQAMEDAIRERTMENSEYGDEWARNFALTNLGLGGDSANVLLTGAGQAGQSGAAATGAAGDLFAQWLARNKKDGDS